MPDQSRSKDIKDALENRLGNLATNIAAISNGRGKPGELVDQIVNVAESLIAYNEAFGTRPEEDLIRRALVHAMSAPQ
jgi:hypothetical protein